MPLIVSPTTGDDWVARAIRFDFDTLVALKLKNEDVCSIYTLFILYVKRIHMQNALLTNPIHNRRNVVIVYVGRPGFTS